MVTALQFHRPSTSGYTGQCIIDGCKRNGRQRMLICGQPLRTTSTISLSRFEWVCDPCAKKWRKLWAELNGSEELRQVEAAIRALKQPVPKRTEAIFALRRFGFSRDGIARAMKGVGDGLKVEQILEGFSADPEAVAA
jgi:hypothetical protein